MSIHEIEKLFIAATVGGAAKPAIGASSNWFQSHLRHNAFHVAERDNSIHPIEKLSIAAITIGGAAKPAIRAVKRYQHCSVSSDTGSTKC